MSLEDQGALWFGVQQVLRQGGGVLDVGVEHDGVVGEQLFRESTLHLHLIKILE